MYVHKHYILSFNPAITLHIFPVNSSTGIATYFFLAAQMAQSSGELIALSIVFSILAIFFVGLRWWARYTKDLELKLDDFLIFAAAVSFGRDLTSYLPTHTRFYWFSSQMFH